MESEEYRDNRTTKQETIELLNDTIARLKTVVSEIESQPSEDLPDLAAVRTLAKNMANLGIAVGDPQNSQIVTQTAASSKPYVTATTASATQPVRTPAQTNRRAIAILSGVVILIVAGFWLWLSPQPLGFLSQKSSPPEVAQVREVPETIENPAPPVETTATPPETEIAEREPEIPDTTIPLELTAPGEAEDLFLETVEPTIQLTPEQSLIAAIQERITSITQDYSEALILSVRADFTASKLSIAVSDDWYELSDSRQSKLADEILQRSRQLDFQKLELKDIDGNLIARSPVVGDRAIIYSSQQGISGEG